jgi:fucose permease
MSNAIVLVLRKYADLTGNLFDIALSLFFVTYIVFELPANMMCKRFGPRIWLSFITLGFGLVTISTAFLSPATWVCSFSGYCSVSSNRAYNQGLCLRTLSSIDDMS